MFDFHQIPLELKSADEGGEIVGYAAVYNNVDSGSDKMLSNCFDKSLAELKTTGRTVKMLWQHDPTKVIGVWDDFTSDDRGLLAKGRILTDVQLGRETLALLRAKALSGLSIGYRTIDAEFKRDPEGRMIREISEAELWETSIVTFPMNSEAGVTDVKQLTSARDVERILRDAGVPNSFAKIVALHGYDEAKNRLMPDHREGDDEADTEQLRALHKNLTKLKEAINA